MTAPAGFQEELLSTIEAVHRFAIHLARDAVQAEDLVQETYLRALAHRDQYQPGTNCRAWLFQICRNAFLKERAQSSREEPADDADLEALAATGLYAGVLGTDPVGGVFERPELADAVARALSRLPEEYRTAVTLVDLEDQSYADVAQILSVPVGTVRSRLFRGRRLLQDDLLVYAEDAGLLARGKESA